MRDSTFLCNSKVGLRSCAFGTEKLARINLHLSRADLKIIASDKNAAMKDAAAIVLCMTWRKYDENHTVFSDAQSSR